MSSRVAAKSSRLMVQGEMMTTIATLAKIVSQEATEDAVMTTTSRPMVVNNSSLAAMVDGEMTMTTNMAVSNINPAGMVDAVMTTTIIPMNGRIDSPAATHEEMTTTQAMAVASKIHLTVVRNSRATVAAIILVSNHMAGMRSQAMVVMLTDAKKSRAMEDAMVSSSQDSGVSRSLTVAAMLVSKACQVPSAVGRTLTTRNMEDADRAVTTSIVATRAAVPGEPVRMR